MDWFDLLAGQGTLKSLLQLESISSSVLNLSFDSTDLCQQSDVSAF